MRMQRYGHNVCGLLLLTTRSRDASISIDLASDKTGVWATVEFRVPWIYCEAARENFGEQPESFVDFVTAADDDFWCCIVSSQLKIFRVVLEYSQMLIGI